MYGEKWQLNILQCFSYLLGKLGTHIHTVHIHTTILQLSGLWYTYRTENYCKLVSNASISNWRNLLFIKHWSPQVPKSTHIFLK